jgi:predicted TIM-barrel fold metal-dependent hydrolase
MASLPLVDTHVHFYDLKHPNLRWAWLEPDFIHPNLGDIDPLKAQRYAAGEFEAETRFQNVSKMIHVQAALGSADPVDETRWLQGMADETGIPNGIVVEAWLAKPDVEELLERHVQYPSVRGVRDFGEGDYLVDPAWQRGFSLLGKYELVCCLDSQPETYRKARSLADRYPEVTLCIDHCGLPRSRTPEYFETWRRELRHLAGADNTVVKISGLGMFDNRWTIDSLRPWVLECIDAFGVARSVFGTNWPVDRLYSSYGDVVDAYAAIIEEFPPDEQVALFSGNAERVFRL